MLPAAAVLLGAWAPAGRADESGTVDPRAYLAQFFQGMTDRDYGKAMRGFLAIVALDGKPETAPGQADCFAALKTGDATRSTSACEHFAALSGSDPKAYIGVALSRVIAERPLDAVTSLDQALKLDPKNLPANVLRKVLAEGGAGAQGNGWAVPSGSSSGDLQQAWDQFANGKFPEAAASFETLFKAGQVHGNVPLMLYIARKRAGIATTGDELAPMRDLGGARYKMLISTLRGEAKPRDALSEFLSGWGEGEDYAADRFFLGEAALLQGDKAEAKRFFTKASAVAQDSIEVRLAKAELARLP